MELPQPVNQTFSSLLNDVEKGLIKIPQFQRDFVWDIKRSANLMDSIIKGYPIGTFIFWKTKERLRSLKEIGNASFPEPPDGDFVNFILDGQQRLTTLFASLKGVTILRESGRTDDYSEIYIDLDANEDERVIKTEIDDGHKHNHIKITDLLYGGFTFLAKFPEAYLKKLEEYKKRIESYPFSIILVKEAPIDVATEIFTRINVGGKTLSLFEIMVAKTYDSKTDFDLSEKYEELMDDLSSVGYDTISNSTILQVISLVLSKECTRKKILTLNKNEFVANWDKSMEAIKSAVDYFRGFYRIPVSQLLPYNAMIVPFAYFFYNHKDKPVGKKQKFLLDFFWRCSLSGRYSSGVENKLAQDIQRIDSILKDELPQYDWSLNVTKDFIIENGWFSTGKSFIKAILSLYAYHQPKSFIDDSIVTIDNNWLKIATSKNYHHFFPKAYLKKLGHDNFHINHILNITIVDDFLNKKKIKDKAPSKYMKEFKKQNKNMDETMKSHLISDLEKFGIWDDNYDKFFDDRAKLIVREIKKRIIEQDIDKEKMIIIHEEFEEEDFSD